jgi:MFS family permease
MLFIGTGFAQNISAVIVLRFLSGAFGSTGSTMVGGTIAGMCHSSLQECRHCRSLTSHRHVVLRGERGTNGRICPLCHLRHRFGPFWAGSVEGNPALQWRWIQFIQAIYTGVIFLLLAVLLRETRGSVLLARKAAKLRKETGNNRYRARAEENRASIPAMIRISLTRPAQSE